MTVALERSATTRTRDPQELLNAVAPHITELTVNIFDSDLPIHSGRLGPSHKLVRHARVGRQARLVLCER